MKAHLLSLVVALVLFGCGDSGVSSSKPHTNAKPASQVEVDKVTPKSTQNNQASAVENSTIKNLSDLGISADGILGEMGEFVTEKKTEYVNNEKVTTYRFDSGMAPVFIQVFNPDIPKKARFVMLVTDKKFQQVASMQIYRAFTGNLIPQWKKNDKGEKWFQKSLAKLLNGNANKVSETVGNKVVSISVAKETGMIIVDVDPK